MSSIAIQTFLNIFFTTASVLDEEKSHILEVRREQKVEESIVCDPCSLCIQYHNFPHVTCVYLGCVVGGDIYWKIFSGKYFQIQ
jgi:hypothetical protein